MSKQNTKTKPKEVVQVSLGDLSYLHKEFEFHYEGIFIDRGDASNNWRYKYILVPIIEEVDGQETVRQDTICIIDTSEWGQKNGMPQS